MQSAFSYRHLAEECERKARQEQSLEYRLGWETLAHSYRLLAEQTEEANRRTQKEPADTSER